MENELIIDGGYLNTPPIQAHAPLISLNGQGAKLVMHDKVFLQNNYNCGTGVGTSINKGGAGVAIRTVYSDTEDQAEFIMKGGTIRGNKNNVQSVYPCGGGVFIYYAGIFTMEGGVTMNNTAV
jgi:hypothetical protein